MRFRNPLSAIIVILFSLSIVTVASAHNTVPRVEISVERQFPGGVVDVRGVSFGMEETVTLTLISSSTEISYGEVISGAEGEFLYIAVLPSDLIAGTYYFRATTSHHWVISPALTIWGTAIVEDSGQGLRDEHGGLPPSIPTFAPTASVLATVSAPVVSAQANQKPASSGWSANIGILVALTGVAVIIGLGFWRKRSKQ